MARGAATGAKVGWGPVGVVDLTCCTVRECSSAVNGRAFEGAWPDWDVWVEECDEVSFAGMSCLNMARADPINVSEDEEEEEEEEEGGCAGFSESTTFEAAKRCLLVSFPTAGADTAALDAPPPPIGRSVGASRETFDPVTSDPCCSKF